MEVRRSSAKGPADQDGDAENPLGEDPGLRAELFNWANALGAFHAEGLASDGVVAGGMSVAAWRPDSDMPMALRKLNRCA